MVVIGGQSGQRPIRKYIQGYSFFPFFFLSKGGRDVLEVWSGVAGDIQSHRLNLLRLFFVFLFGEWYVESGMDRN